MGLFSHSNDTDRQISMDHKSVVDFDNSATSIGTAVQPASADDGILDPSNLVVYTKERILDLVDIAEVPGKGQCMFVRDEYEAGSLIMIEAPLFVIVPASNPGVWDVLKSLHDQDALTLPPLWHQAALLSIINGNEEKWEILKGKWVLNRDQPVCDDVYRVLQAICNVDENGTYIYNDKIVIDPKKYQLFLQVWPLNAFGHSNDPDGLVIYDVVSYMAHSCDASCCWHHCGQDNFILRARRKLVPGDEVTISYLGETDLLAPTFKRREMLENWSFYCACERCSRAMDEARGFLCKNCYFGSVYFFQSSTNGLIHRTLCTLCNYSFTCADILEYLDLERAYIQRIESIDTNDLHDILQVYDHAKNVFKQHWVLYQLQTLLFEQYKQKGNITEATLYLMDRINYADQIMKRPLYCVAFMYEEMADLLVTRADIDVETLVVKNNDTDIGTINVIMHAYFKAAALLAILCGYNHTYYCTVVSKRSKIEEIAVLLMEQERKNNKN